MPLVNKRDLNAFRSNVAVPGTRVASCPLFKGWGIVMNIRKTLALAALALLIGWIISGDRNHVQAQAAVVQPVLCYEIPTAGDSAIRLGVVRGTGYSQFILLNRCTGDSWAFDSGWNNSGNQYTPPSTWVRIERDSL